MDNYLTERVNLIEKLMGFYAFYAMNKKRKNDLVYKKVFPCCLLSVNPKNHNIPFIKHYNTQPYIDNVAMKSSLYHYLESYKVNSFNNATCPHDSSLLNQFQYLVNKHKNKNVTLAANLN